LAYVLILVQAFLGNVAFLELDAEVEILLHDWFMDLLPRSMSLAFDDIVQSIQSSLLLPNINKLYKHTQSHMSQSSLWICGLVNADQACRRGLQNTHLLLLILKCVRFNIT